MVRDRNYHQWPTIHFNDYPETSFISLSATADNSQWNEYDWRWIRAYTLQPSSCVDILESMHGNFLTFFILQTRVQVYIFLDPYEYSTSLFGNVTWQNNDSYDEVCQNDERRKLSLPSVIVLCTFSAQIVGGSSSISSTICRRTGFFFGAEWIKRQKLANDLSNGTFQTWLQLHLLSKWCGILYTCTLTCSIVFILVC